MFGPPDAFTQISQRFQLLPALVLETVSAVFLTWNGREIWRLETLCVARLHGRAIIARISREVAAAARSSDYESGKVAHPDLGVVWTRLGVCALDLFAAMREEERGTREKKRDVSSG